MVLSELCHQCSHRYTQINCGQTCQPCPDTNVTVLLMCSAVLLAVALFEFLVWDTLDSANNMITEVKATWVDSNHTTTHINMLFHSIVIQIISLYLQIASMLLQFDLQLPPSVCVLVVVEALTSLLSELLLSINCATLV